ncbi:MAG TPA: hypothetical protein VIU33_07235, partial [Nitrospiria bacterium]
MPEPHYPAGIPRALLVFFQKNLEPSVQNDLGRTLEAIPPSDRSLTVELLSELTEASPRSAKVCLKGLTAFYEQGGVGPLI